MPKQQQHTKFLNGTLFHDLFSIRGLFVSAFDVHNYSKTPPTNWLGVHKSTPMFGQTLPWKPVLQNVSIKPDLVSLFNLICVFMVFTLGTFQLTQHIVVVSIENKNNHTNSQMRREVDEWSKHTRIVFGKFIARGCAHFDRFTSVSRCSTYKLMAQFSDVLKVIQDRLSNIAERGVKCDNNESKMSARPNCTQKPKWLAPLTLTMHI